ncbi:recombinase family protein [Streptomyces sp. ALI-76-A]|jgi:DNA invertase Pin-like site-specific DNA recombinase|uniref:recombinase family protein n=1 Tax=Streptomyces sp. ALI-76-A TaxID=3025736 RepID=UPI00256EFE10|nr:recombinase family protein [Streptomyces sp. ALI-76-A]MDL5205063.1 recombinase family protein [Streptomyces sp. ALI-76-A]
MAFDPSYLHLVFPDTQFEAYLYGRASRDPNKRGDSVEDQLSAGRAMCQTHNWHIAEEFKDLGLSASRHAKQSRDDFEDLLEAIEDTPARPGVIRIVVAYEASRYYRDLEAYVRLRAACLNAGVLLCYKGTVYDLSRSDDRKATAMDAIAAEGEADDIRDRNLRTARRTAAAGDPHGRLLFGYSRDYEVVNGQLRCVRQYENKVTGPYVYRSIAHIDQGSSVASLLRWLNSEPNAARADGRPWNTRNVRLMLLNRAYLGERKNKGEWTPATWPAIKGLDTPAGRAMFNRVTATLTDPARCMQRGSAPVHLQTLIALCGECGDHALLEGQPIRGVPYLRCREKQDTSVREDWADAFVEEAVLKWFRKKREATAALVADDGEIEEKVAAAQRRINSFEEQLAEARSLAEEFDEESGRFKLSAASLASMEQRLVPKLEQERKKLQDMTGVSPLLLSLLNAEDPDVVWNGRLATETEVGRPALTLEQRREVLRTVVTVRLYKAKTPGVHWLEPDRIRLSFVGEAGFRDGRLRVPASVPAPGASAAGAPGAV